MRMVIWDYESITRVIECQWARRHYCIKVERTVGLLTLKIPIFNPTLVASGSYYVNVPVSGGNPTTRPKNAIPRRTPGFERIPEYLTNKVVSPRIDRNKKKL